MSRHGYEGGRLDLPFVGISTFGKRPYEPDWSKLDADVAILGAPFDGAPNTVRVRVSGRAVCARHRRCSASGMRRPMIMRTMPFICPAM